MRVETVVAKLSAAVSCDSFTRITELFEIAIVRLSRRATAPSRGFLSAEQGRSAWVVLSQGTQGRGPIINQT